MLPHLKTIPFRLIFPKSNIENFLSYVTDLKFVFSLRSFARIYIENTLYILLADQVTKPGIPPPTTVTGLALSSLQRINNIFLVNSRNYFNIFKLKTVVQGLNSVTSSLG